MRLSKTCGGADGGRYCSTSFQIGHPIESDSVSFGARRGTSSRSPASHRSSSPFRRPATASLPFCICRVLSVLAHRLLVHARPSCRAMGSGMTLFCRAESAASRESRLRLGRVPARPAPVCPAATAEGRSTPRTGGTTGLPSAASRARSSRTNRSPRAGAGCPLVGIPPPGDPGARCLRRPPPVAASAVVRGAGQLRIGESTSVVNSNLIS